MLRIEPVLPMLRMLPALPMLRIDPALPMLRMEAALRMLPMLRKLSMLRVLLALSRLAAVRRDRCSFADLWYALACFFPNTPPMDDATPRQFTTAPQERPD